MRKNPEKPHPGNFSRPGIEPGPAAWPARMLPLAPQRWTQDTQYGTISFLYNLGMVTHDRPTHKVPLELNEIHYVAMFVQPFGIDYVRNTGTEVC